LDVLKFWETNQEKYGELSNLTRDVLSVPLSAVDLQSTFSIGGPILTKWKSTYIPENVKALITPQSWLYGFQCTNSMFSIFIIDISFFLNFCESCLFCFILVHEEEEFVGSNVE